MTLDVSLHFIKGCSVLQSFGFTLDISLHFVNFFFYVLKSTRFSLVVSLHFVKGFSVLQSSGSSLDVSLPFVVKHDLKANIREKIANIYPLIRWWQTPEIGLFSAWTIGDVTYLYLILKTV